MTLTIKVKGKYIPTELLLENDNGMVVGYDNPAKVIAITKDQVKELESKPKVKIGGQWMSIKN